MQLVHGQLVAFQFCFESSLWIRIFFLRFLYGGLSSSLLLKIILSKFELTTQRSQVGRPNFRKGSSSTRCNIHCSDIRIARNR